VVGAASKTHSASETSVNSTPQFSVDAATLVTVSTLGIAVASESYVPRTVIMRPACWVPVVPQVVHPKLWAPVAFPKVTAWAKPVEAGSILYARQWVRLVPLPCVRSNSHPATHCCMSIRQCSVCTSGPSGESVRTEESSSSVPRSRQKVSTK